MKMRRQTKWQAAFLWFPVTRAKGDSCRQIFSTRGHLSANRQPVGIFSKEGTPPFMVGKIDFACLAREGMEVNSPLV